MDEDGKPRRLLTGLLRKMSIDAVNTRLYRRKLFIRIARKRQRPGSGSSLQFLRRRTVAQKFPDLTDVLQGIPWAFVGAAATRLYMPERLTGDLDILVHAEDSSAVRSRLLAAGYKQLGDLAIQGGPWESSDGFPLDVLETDEGWCSDALHEAASNRDAAGNPVLPLPYLVLLKLRAGRAQDIADVTRMLGQASEGQLALVRSVFERWAPGDREDLDSLTFLGQLEMQPADEGISGQST